MNLRHALRQRAHDKRGLDIREKREVALARVAGKEYSEISLTNMESRSCYIQKPVKKKNHSVAFLLVLHLRRMQDLQPM